MWLKADEALQRLGSKPQSLYANVSRGRIRAKPDPMDSRRSLYREEDVDRVAARSRGRRTAVALAAEAVDFGEAILPTAISTIAGGRLIYRGRDAAQLADTSTLEEVAALLWEAPYRSVRPGDAVTGSALEAVAALATTAPPSSGRGARALQIEASEVHAVVAAAITGNEDGPLHRRLAKLFGRPQASEAVRRALVLLADHELNASTFAARVTVSTGASLAAATLAGLAALGGPRHGQAAVEVAVLAEEVAHYSVGPEEGLLHWLGEGRTVPGFGHRLYPGGDVRCRALLAAFEVPAAFRDLREAGELVLDEAPNVDFALAAMTSAFDLPHDAPATIFALARSVGWLAHAMEQAAAGTLIRPRARYIGRPLADAVAAHD